MVKASSKDYSQNSKIFLSWFTVVKAVSKDYSKNSKTNSTCLFELVYGGESFAQDCSHHRETFPRVMGRYFHLEIRKNAFFQKSICVHVKTLQRYICKNHLETKINYIYSPLFTL